MEQSTQDEINRIVSALESDTITEDEELELITRLQELREQNQLVEVVENVPVSYNQEEIMENIENVVVELPVNNTGVYFVEDLNETQIAELQKLTLEEELTREITYIEHIENIVKEIYPDNYDILHLKDAPKDYRDTLSFDSNRNKKDIIQVTIFFENIYIYNSSNKHLIPGLAVVFFIDEKTNVLIGSFTGYRHIFTKAEYMSSYGHSHLSGGLRLGYDRESTFCLGANDTEISLSVYACRSDLKSNLKSFLVTLMGYVAWESRDGGPYRYFSSVSDYNNNESTLIGRENDFSNDYHSFNNSVSLRDFHFVVVNESRRGNLMKSLAEILEIFSSYTTISYSLGIYDNGNAYYKINLTKEIIDSLCQKHPELPTRLHNFNIVQESGLVIKINDQYHTISNRRSESNLRNYYELYSPEGEYKGSTRYLLNTSKGPILQKIIIPEENTEDLEKSFKTIHPRTSLLIIKLAEEMYNNYKNIEQ